MTIYNVVYIFYKKVAAFVTREEIKAERVAIMGENLKSLQNESEKIYLLMETLETLEKQKRKISPSYFKCSIESQLKKDCSMFCVYAVTATGCVVMKV